MSALSKELEQALRALSEYKGTAYPMINEAARNPNATGKFSDMAKQIETLGKPSDFGMELSRHTNGIFDEAGNSALPYDSINEGDILSNYGFASTTHKFDDDYMKALSDVHYDNDIPNTSTHFVIRAEPGTKMLHMEDELNKIYPTEFGDHEAETLLMPKQKYMVMGKEKFKTDAGNEAHRYYLQMPSDDMEGFDQPIKGYIASLAAPAAGAGLLGASLSPDDASAFNPSEIPMEQYLQSLANRAAHDAPDTRRGFGNPNFTAPEHNKDLDIRHMPVPVGALNPSNALLRHVRENAVGATNDLSDAMDSSNGLGHRFTSALMGALGIIGIPETSLLETPLDYVEKPNNYYSAKTGMPQ